MKNKLIDISDTILFLSSIILIFTLAIDLIVYYTFLFKNVGISNVNYADVEPQIITIVYIVGGCGCFLELIIRTIAKITLTLKNDR